MTFEEWWKDAIGLYDRKELARHAWNAALEEAAQMCETLGEKGWDTDVTGMCAMAIYALKRQ